MSSVGEIGVTIKAVNEATPEFEAVVADAAGMASAVSGSPLTLTVQNLASPEIAKVGEDAARVKTEVESSPITVAFAPVEVPALPPIDVAPIQESFNQVDTSALMMSGTVSSVSAEAYSAFSEVGLNASNMGASVEAAGSSFSDMQTHAEACEVSLRSVASGIGSFGRMGSEVTMLAGSFGLVDKETAQWMRTVTTMITLISTAARMYNFLTLMTTGQTAAVAIEGTTETATTGAISLSAVAHNIYGATCNFATACQNALNISHATFLALTGVGIGVIIAAATAVAIFASNMNAATSSVKNYNAAAGQTPAATKGIQRAGEQSMLRRGVEG